MYVVTLPHVVPKLTYSIDMQRCLPGCTEHHTDTQSDLTQQQPRTGCRLWGASGPSLVCGQSPPEAQGPAPDTESPRPDCKSSPVRWTQQT